MDFIVEEELCQQADEVWRHYACPACDGSAPPSRPALAFPVPAGCDGPCSVLPVVFSSSFADSHDVPAAIRITLQ